MEKPLANAVRVALGTRPGSAADSHGRPSAIDDLPVCRRQGRVHQAPHRARLRPLAGAPPLAPVLPAAQVTAVVDTRNLRRRRAGRLVHGRQSSAQPVVDVRADAGLGRAAPLRGLRRHARVRVQDIPVMVDTPQRQPSRWARSGPAGRVPGGRTWPARLLGRRPEDQHHPRQRHLRRGVHARERLNSRGAPGSLPCECEGPARGFLAPGGTEAAETEQGPGGVPTAIVGLQRQSDARLSGLRSSSSTCRCCTRAGRGALSSDWQRGWRRSLYSTSYGANSDP